MEKTKFDDKPLIDQANERVLMLSQLVIQLLVQHGGRLTITADTIKKVQLANTTWGIAGVPQPDGSVEVRAIPHTPAAANDAAADDVPVAGDLPVDAVPTKADDDVRR